jgi:hypothetical protein
MYAYISVSKKSFAYSSAGGQEPMEVFLHYDDLADRRPARVLARQSADGEEML